MLGLEVGRREAARRWIFMHAGGARGMVALQEDPGQWPAQHFAFTVSAEAFDAAVAELANKGVALEGPMTHGWMPAPSVYFADPDGHDLELCTPLGGARAATP